MKKAAVQYSFSSRWGDMLDLGPEGIEMLGDPRKFDPDWVIAPGETLKEWLETTPLPLTLQRRATGLTYDELDALKNGDLPITPTVALGLEQLTSIPARLWIALEHNYRAGLAAGKTRI